MALILHAYSPGNAGDGLLVDLAIRHIRESIGRVRIVVVASDAKAFADINSDPTVEFVQWGALWGASDRLRRRLSMVATILTGAPPSIAELALRADLIVAVGGGYLRGGDWKESLKSLGAHYRQLQLAAQNGDRAVYLPQSIGPFSGAYKKRIATRLESISTVYVRDDRSRRDFAGVESVRRAPDLAVLELAAAPVDPLSRNSHGRPVFVARAIRNPRTYTRLLETVRDSGQFDWAVQSTSGANNDLPIIRKYGTREPLPLSHYVNGGQYRVVVSTRLHGSMAGLLAGMPTIHLSYERKGWGAFDDLGLSRFVLPARDACLDDIVSLMAEIDSDPRAYWDAVENARARLIEQHAQLRASIISASRTIGWRDA